MKRRYSKNGNKKNCFVRSYTEWKEKRHFVIFLTAEKTNWLLCRVSWHAGLWIIIIKIIIKTITTNINIIIIFEGKKDKKTKRQDDKKTNWLLGRVSWHVGAGLSCTYHSFPTQQWWWWWVWWWSRWWFDYHKCEHGDQKAWKAFESCQSSLQKIFFILPFFWSIPKVIKSSQSRFSL